MMACEVLRDRLQVAKDIKWQMAMIFCIFFVSLSIFPTVAQRIETSGRIFSVDWSPGVYFVIIYCFVGFNLFDTVGRTLAGVVPFPKHGLPIAVLLRTAFVPLFLLCNFDGNGQRLFSHDDALPSVFMLLMALSNGYLGSRVMMSAPDMVTSEHKEMASATMVLMLTAGISAGTVASTGFSSIAQIGVSPVNATTPG